MRQKEEGNTHDQILNEVLRFLQINSTVIDSHPLQLYSSLLYSIPPNTVLDKMLTKEFPSWLQHAPEPDKTSDRPRYILEGHERPIGRCKMSLDNSTLVSCSEDGREMRVWDLKTGECTRVITNEGGLGWREFDLSYDGSWIVSYSSVDSDPSGSTVERQSYSTHKEDYDDISEEESNASHKEHCDTSSEEESGTSIKGLEFLKLWNVANEHFIEHMLVQCHYGGNVFQFSPNSKFLVFMQHSGKAIVRHLHRDEPSRETRLTIRNNGRKRFYPYHNAQGHDDESFYCIEFSPDSSLVTIISAITKEYAIWETETFECIRYGKLKPFLQNLLRRKVEEQYATSLALAGDASIIVAAALTGDSWNLSSGRVKDGKLEIIWLESELIISEIDCKTNIFKTQFSPDQTLLASIFQDGSVGTWRVKTGECLTMSYIQSNAGGLCFSPDLELIISTGGSTTASVWANHPRETDPKLSGNWRDPIESVILSSDHTLAASFSSRGSVKVWNTKTCNCIFQFDAVLQEQISAHQTTLDLLHFTKDKRYLFAAWATAIGKPSSFYDDRHQWSGHFQGWDIIKGQEVIGLQTNIHAGRFRGSAVLITPDERWIILARDQNVTIIAIDTFSITREMAFPGPIYGLAISPNSQSLFALVFEDETSVAPGGKGREWTDKRCGFSLFTFSMVKNEQPVNIALPLGVQDIFAISLDSKFLVLKSRDGPMTQSVAPAVLSDSVKVLYRFPDPGYRSNSPAPMSLIQNDSVLLSYDAPNLDLRNSFTGRIIRRLKVDFGSGYGSEPRRLHFNTTTQQVHTNFGTIAIHEDPVGGCDVGFSLDKHLTGFGINADRSWLLWKNRQILWLQPTFRPNNFSTIEVSGSTIIIGTSHGRVLFFKFNGKEGSQLFQ